MNRSFYDVAAIYVALCYVSAESSLAGFSLSAEKCMKIVVWNHKVLLAKPLLCELTTIIYPLLCTVCVDSMTSLHFYKLLYNLQCIYGSMFCLGQLKSCKQKFSYNFSLTFL